MEICAIVNDEDAHHNINNLAGHQRFLTPVKREGFLARDSIAELKIKKKKDSYCVVTENFFYMFESPKVGAFTEV